MASLPILGRSQMLYIYQMKSSILNLYDTFIHQHVNTLLKSFFQYLSYNHIDIRSLFSKNTFCIGKKTQEELERRATASRVMSESNSSDMFTYIKEHKNASLYQRKKAVVDCPIDSLSTYQICTNRI